MTTTDRTYATSIQMCVLATEAHGQRLSTRGKRPLRPSSCSAGYTPVTQCAMAVRQCTRHVHRATVASLPPRSDGAPSVRSLSIGGRWPP